jgi:hypothetical protein
MDQMISSFQVAKPGVFVLGGGIWAKPQWRLSRPTLEKLPAGAPSEPVQNAFSGVFVRTKANRLRL